MLTQDSNTGLHLALQPHDDLLYYMDNRCSYETTVQSLLKGGADPRIKNWVSIVDNGG